MNRHSINKVRKMIGKGKTKDALEFLKSIKGNKTYCNDIILLQSRYAVYNRSDDENIVQLTKINRSILKLLDEIEEDINQQNAEKRQNAFLIFLTILVITLIPAAFYYLYFFSKPDWLDVQNSVLVIGIIGSIILIISISALFGLAISKNIIYSTYYYLGRFFFTLKYYLLKTLILLNPWQSPSLRWLFKIRRRHFILTMTTALAPALISAIITVFYGVIYSKKLAEFSIVVLIVFIVVLLVVAFFLFRRLPPNNYAIISVGGTGIKDALRIVSYENWKVLIRFKYENQALQRISKSLLKNPNVPEPNFWRNLKIIYFILQLEYLENSQQRELQNITEVKKLVSKNFQIPQRRLCDYILQFSPSIYHELIKKYLSNWKELEMLLRRRDAPLLMRHTEERLGDLARSTNRLYIGITELIQYQIQLLKFHKYHHYIHSIGHDWSTSSSLKNYIEALSEMAAENKPDPEKIYYLYIKRNAHPGFDLHRACENFCKVYETNLLINVQQLNQFFIEIRSVNNYRKLNIRKYKTAIEGFFLNFHDQIVSSRNLIIKKFIERFPAIIDREPFQNTLIIIQGYSKTVRQVVKKGLSELLETIPGEAIMPQIFLLKSDNEDDDLLTSRIMRYELQSDSNFPIIKNRLIAGDIDYLKCILRPGLQTVIFLGAECFDVTEDGKVNRVMHVNGISKSILALKAHIKKVTGKTCKAVLFAEKYKMYDNLLNELEFYRDHLEGIDIYTKGMIDHYITDE